MEGSHSPFGFIYQICKDTGWSVRYVMWKIPYPELLLMQLDAPHYVDKDIKKKESGQSALNFFQTQLKNGKNG